MTVIDKYPITHDIDLKQQPLFQTHEIPRKSEQFAIRSFSEQTDPESALLVQQIHGESYVDSGFVDSSTLDEYGRLSQSIDRARGDNVTYYLAEPKSEDKVGGASLRIIDIPDGGTVDDLPAFSYGRSTMYEDCAMELRQAGLEGRLREVSSLSHSKGISSIGSFELIRQIIQEAIKNKSDEVWLVNFVTSAHRSICANFSPKTIRQIGEPLAIGEDYEGVSSGVKLLPVMIEPCKIPDQMVEFIEDELTTPSDRQRVLRTLHFVLDGLESYEISDSATRLIDNTPREDN